MATLPVVARAAQVNEARVWADSSHTRLVFDLTDKPDYRLDRQRDAVVLELAGGQLAAGFADPAARGLYRGMSHRLHAGRLRITAQMVDGSKARSFVLAPSRKTGHYRLVLDLLPGQGQSALAQTKADAKPTAPAEATPLATAEPVPESTPVAEVTSHHHGKRGVGASRQVTEQAAALLNGQRKVVVCIDAGHGGKDTGAIGPDGTDEKNVTLAVARDLAAEINKQPGMQAILTRDDDTFIPLAQRYRIAREHDADLFVSIHADSYTSGDARGSSVWVLSSRG
jgi:N-acetylmuramoyl-L-alanine amidase